MKDREPLRVESPFNPWVTSPHPVGVVSHPDRRKTPGGRGRKTSFRRQLLVEGYQWVETESPRFGTVRTHVP